MTGTSRGRLVGLDVAAVPRAARHGRHPRARRAHARRRPHHRPVAGRRPGIGALRGARRREPRADDPRAAARSAARAAHPRHRRPGAADRRARPRAGRPGHRHRDHPHLLRRAVRPGPAVHAPRCPRAPAARCRHGSWSRRSVSHLVGDRTCRSGGSTARPSSSSPTPGSWRASCSSPATTRSCRGWRYLLAGLVLGRLDLRDTSLLGGLALGGLSVAVLATQVSRYAGRPGGRVGERHRDVRHDARRRRLGAGCCSSRPTRRRRSTSPRRSAARSS